MDYCGDRFAIYTSIESLCCTPETNVICQSYLNFLKKKMFQPPELALGKSLGNVTQSTICQEASSGVPMAVREQKSNLR